MLCKVSPNSELKLKNGVITKTRYKKTGLFPLMDQARKLHHNLQGQQHALILHHHHQPMARRNGICQNPSTSKISIECIKENAVHPPVVQMRVLNTQRHQYHYEGY